MDKLTKRKIDIELQENYLLMGVACALEYMLNDEAGHNKISDEKSRREKLERMFAEAKESM